MPRMWCTRPFLCWPGSPTVWARAKTPATRPSCTTHRHYAHDQVEQIRYAVTEYQCPDCPKIVPCAELQHRTVCYTLTEGLTYAAEPTY